MQPGSVTALLERLAQAPVTAPHRLEPGRRVGRYEVIRRIGHGGFGSVYEAHDGELQRLVALKVLDRGGASAPGAEVEGEAAARLSHPNVATLHDAGLTEAGAPYLVYELLHGETLESRLARGPLSAADALRVAAAVAAALAHAHAAGVVHRDLKPSNVFLCADGEVKVLDFGVALVFGRPAPQAGTPGYMAPEQVRGEPEDARTDLYALGLLLREMLAGTPGTPGADARRVPPATGRVLAALLADDPGARPRSARAAIALLEDAARGAPRRLRRPWVAVALATLVAAAAGAATLALRDGAGRPAPPGPSAQPAPAALPSIAVMPFADLSPERDQEYFSHGLAEEILNALSQLEGLRVAGRSSSFSFRGKNADAATIAGKLGVSALLDGSVRKAGNRVRITAELVNAADGFHLWSQTYDRELGDVFAVQDDIARAVVGVLRVKLLGSAPSTERYRTPNPEVYEQYLRARGLVLRATPDRLREAMGVYERALELDPSYAPAWAGLAVATYWYGNSLERGEDVALHKRKALAAAERAIALDPRLADGYTARALVRSTFTDDRRLLEADLRHALSLNPGLAKAHMSLAAWVLHPEGRNDEALAALRRATELDPLMPAAWGHLTWLHLTRGAWAEARAAANRTRELVPAADPPVHYLVLAAVLGGRPAEAVPLLDRASSLFQAQDVALVRHALGDAAGAREALAELEARFGEVGAFQVAEVHAFRGDRDRAIDWLERAFRQRDDGLIDLAVSPMLRSLHGDPRYAAMLERLRLPAPPPRE